ncbi:MAG: NAD-dependent epimerase/dehydratase family protein, partial [Ignavibacteria bacterium]|nr:NAD-dependent epimerase/dehydratase family protein [Ignavibacteria bacterium]
MNILVTGGAGFIGSHITDEYIKRNHKVVVVDNLSTGSIENVNKKAVFYKTDICKDNLGRLLEKHKIEVINHHSAQIDVRKSVEKPVFDLRVNLEATVKLLQASIKYNIKKFIFA